MRIACLLSEGFEDSEFQKPCEEFRNAGHEVTVIGSEAGQELKGKGGKVTAKSEAAIGAVRADAYDALFIPGGNSPDHLRADDRFVEFTRAFFDPERPVLAICHGPQLLMTADLVEGRRMTAWKTVQGDLKKAGARVEDAEVVVDGHLVTSRQPSDLPAFVRESLALLERAPVTG